MAFARLVSVSVSQVCGVDADELALLDEHADHGPVIAARVRSLEQGVLAVESGLPVGALDGIVVEIDVAMAHEPGEPVPAGAYRGSPRPVGHPQ